jgi:integrase
VITKARVMARDKDRTKTSEDRTVALCPRALEVLKRQVALRERWQRLGTRIDHEHVFFKDDGEPIRHLHYGWKRWRHSLKRLSLRPRAPDRARRSVMTWNLMIGKNPLWVAKQHGHRTRAAGLTRDVAPAQALRSTRKYVAEREGFEPSKGF